MALAIFLGALLCAVDGLILLYVYQSEGGFLLGCFGFVVGLFSSAIVSAFAD